MDTNKDNASLGQNTNPDPTTSLEDVVPTVSPTAGNAIFSSSDLPTATPANAPLPTDPLHPIQTVGTGRGDVVVDNRIHNAKKPLIIGLIVSAVALFVLLLMLPLLLRNDNQEILALFRQNLDSTEQIESFFQNVYFRETTTNDIMNPETREMLNQNINQFTNFQEKLAKIDTDKLDAEVRDDVKKVQDALAKQAGAFKQSVDLYNILYTVYETENTDSLKDYLTSENYTIATIAERFDEFVQEKKDLQAEMDANSCVLDGNNIAAECTEIAAEYKDVVESMSQSFSVPQAIFFAYDENDEITYDEENAVVDAMRRVIEKLKK
ncbi:hypothetical protein [Mediterraneibacter agrestimuris]|uniref:hypothetical protein n=1 Tax=Mediterraneibacter agrestimuris TaxID=2941333 RepID=UPI00203A7A52|nr:hypothetical protein [Mediterraneibacter agrestimuris]